MVRERGCGTHLGHRPLDLRERALRFVEDLLDGAFLYRGVLLKIFGDGYLEVGLYGQPDVFFLAVVQLEEGDREGIRG